jgi:pentatricopeptide repeat protein
MNLKLILFYQLILLLTNSGERHVDVAATYNNMANSYSDQGYHAKALEFYEKSLDIRQEKLGSGERYDAWHLKFTMLFLLFFKIHI